MAKAACPPADPGAAWAVLIIPKTKRDVRLSGLERIYTFSQIRPRTNGGKVFLLKSLGRRGEQNKLASQTHIMKFFYFTKMLYMAKVIQNIISFK